MRLAGEQRIEAGRQAVWDALTDPEVLARCIEGCEAMSRIAHDTYHAKIKAKIGPLSATFDAEIKLADLDPPNRYRLEASARGGAAGFGKGTAAISLVPDGEGTLLRYEAEGSVGGKLAQIGERLVDPAAHKLAEDFFESFSEAVAPRAPEPAAAGPTNEPAPRLSFGVIAAAFVGLIAFVAVVVLLVRH
jgi:carbon monoxide dehydrogenase subunit G